MSITQIMRYAAGAARQSRIARRRARAYQVMCMLRTDAARFWESGWDRLYAKEAQHVDG